MESNTQNLVSQLQPLGNHLPLAGDQEKPPIKVAITGAAGQIGSFLCHFVAQGRMFGPYQKVILSMIEMPMAEKALTSLKMEMQDCYYPLVDRVESTYEIDVGFKDADAAILVGARPRGPGMERKDLLEANSKIFEV